jgi:hypothetical protein
MLLQPNQDKTKIDRSRFDEDDFIDEKRSNAVIDAKLNPREKMDNILTKSGRVLIRVSSIFPFTLFPDTITVDETKVNIVSRIFFYSQNVTSVLIHDIRQIVVSSNPFFSTIYIHTIPMDPDYPKPDPVKYLHNNEAVKTRRIIQGLKACIEEGIDISKFQTEELVPKVEEIGKTRAQ